MLETMLDDATIVAAFTDLDRAALALRQVTTHEGYRILTNTVGTWTVGVRDGTVVEAFRTDWPARLGDRMPLVERLIDARRAAHDAGGTHTETTPRYVHASDAFGRFVTGLGLASLMYATTAPAHGADTDAPADTDADTDAPGPGRVRANGAIGDVCAVGTAYRIDGERTLARHVRLFDDATTAAAAADLSPTEGVLATWGDVSIGTDGRAVTARATLDPASYVYWAGPRGPTAARPASD
jgi:hypothetical protein